MNEIIKVEQLPIISEQLKTISAQVMQRVKAVTALVCTEDTIAAIKKERANLNNEFKGWEAKRKDVKTAIMSPYEKFENVYKECITNVYNSADATLKQKIEAVENEQKEKKSKEVIDYFNELKTAADIDFITFPQARISITLSASIKSLKEQAKAFVDRTCSDINLINTQDFADEIMYEYKKSLNVSDAITTVVNRHKALEAEKVVAKQTVVPIEEPTVSPVPLEAPVVEAPVVEEQTFTLSFKVTATKKKLKELKAFLENGGYDYE